MSEKKQKGKQAWCLNTVAILKPYIERKEHITRTTANRLVKPVTNWQRRELDTLRKQANQIIRGENVSALTYTVFGMTLEHPELQPVKEAFDATLQQHRETYTLPLDLQVRGVQSSEEKVFFDEQYHPRKAIVGDVWLIRQEYASTMDMLIVENEHTYVIIPGAVNASDAVTRGYRCIYPECVKVADIDVIYSAPPAESQRPAHPAMYMGLVVVETELPEDAQPGHMYGVTNGRSGNPEYTVVRDLDNNWVRMMNNPVDDYDSHCHKAVPTQLTTTAPDVETVLREPRGLPSNIVLADPAMASYLTRMHATTHGSVAIASDTAYIFDKQYGWCLLEAYNEPAVPMKRSFMQRLLSWFCK